MFVLPPLPYTFNALEPYIDARTMEIHYTKHHQTYVDELNKAVDTHPALKKKSLTELLTSLDSIPEDIRTVVRNNGGGHENHSFFWQCMKPKGGGMPSEELKEAIEKRFGNFDAFKQEFGLAAKKRFGSGWAWLVLNKNKELEIVSTPNQDSPISQGLTPLLGLDVWEHAYYLHYQNKRMDYVQAWWNVVNWDFVADNYKHALSK